MEMKTAKLMIKLARGTVAVAADPRFAYSLLFTFNQ